MPPPPADTNIDDIDNINDKNVFVNDFVSGINDVNVFISHFVNTKVNNTTKSKKSSTLHLVNDINDINCSSFLPEMARPRLRPNSGGGGAP